MIQRTRFIDVFSGSDERDGQKINIQAGCQLDIFTILVGQRASRQAAPLQIDPLVIGQLATKQHGGTYSRPFNCPYLEHDIAVIQHEDVAVADILGQCLVGHANGILVAIVFAQRSIEHKLRTLFEDYLLVTETIDPDFWPLQVAQNSDRSTDFLRTLTDQINPATMLYGISMGKVDANHVDSTVQQRNHRLRVIRCRPQGGDDFGLSDH